MITIRLKGSGKKSRKEWRIVVTESRSPQNGQHLEEIGSYNPLVNPPKVKIQMDRYEAWVQRGAQPSRVVRTLAEEAKKTRAH